MQQESPMHQWRTSSPDLMVLGGMVHAPFKAVAVAAPAAASAASKAVKKVDRRLSLPESAMISPDNTDDEGGGPRIKPFPSLLESQV